MFGLLQRDRDWKFIIDLLFKSYLELLTVSSSADGIYPTEDLYIHLSIFEGNMDERSLKS